MSYQTAPFIERKAIEGVGDLRCSRTLNSNQPEELSSFGLFLCFDMEEKIGSGYYVTIPMKVLLDENLSPKARLLFGVIANLSNQRGYCFATNNYLSEVTGWHKDTISDFVNQLLKSSHLIKFNEVTNNGLERRLFISDVGKAKRPMGGRRNGLDPIGETALQNNISIIDKENNQTSDSKESEDTNTFYSEAEDNTKEKEKKITSKKKEKAADPCYKDMVAAWCEAYPLLGFNGSSGKCINDIITKTRQVMTGRGKEATCDALVNSFKYVIAYVKRERHFCDGKPLTTWNSQYLSIVHEIANGKSKPKSVREQINQL